MSKGEESPQVCCHNEGCHCYSHSVSDGTNCQLSWGEPQRCPEYLAEPAEQTATDSRSIFETIAAEIGELVTAKNIAYGDSFAKCGEFLRLLYPSGIAPESYDDALAMVRIFDKQMRIATQKDALSESPYRDIAGYGILGAAKDQGKGE